jgi:hypothetical protein
MFLHANEAVLRQGFVAVDAEMHKAVKYSSLTADYISVPLHLRHLML